MKALGFFAIIAISLSVRAQDPRALQVTCEAYSIYQDAQQLPEADPEELCRAFGGRSCSLVDNLGQAICQIFDGTSCILVDNTGQGICRAAGASSCLLVESIGQGLCRSLGGTSCVLVENIGEGLCRGLGGSHCSFVNSTTEIQSWLIRFRNACRQAF